VVHRRGQPGRLRGCERTRQGHARLLPPVQAQRNQEADRERRAEGRRAAV
jgi:hypothetical protein